MNEFKKLFESLCDRRVININCMTNHTFKGMITEWKQVIKKKR